ncbi:LysR family substrate-binding domain-containing protein [Saccharopolyspora elongata]|uniref:LysR family substrate-binding domain-containing protein n=1 Tax=Saccharopolyspora elongata TaxID=2530387 RepID=UPI0014047C84|nr:LysR family substrate-binding domain-containing protein [Saccharopolyspora elongata]
MDAFDLGSVPSAVIGLVPSLLSLFAEAEPAVSIRVHELSVEEQLELLRTADLDIGIFRSREPLDGWATFDLPPDRFAVALPEGHPLARTPTVRWQDLADERFVMAGRAKAPLEFDSVVGACVANGFTPKVLGEAVSGYNLVALVASGLGVAILPERATALKLEGAPYRRLEPAVEAAPLRIVVRPECLRESIYRLVEIAQETPVPSDPASVDRTEI